jgi:class 3 adenylate cyclase
MLTGSWVREGFKELSARYKQLGRLPTISDYTDVITANPTIPIRQRNPNIPEPLAKVIDQALCEEEIPHDPYEMREMLKELRYSDAGTFRQALINVIKEIKASKAAIHSQERYHERTTEDTIWGTTATRKPLPGKEVALLLLDLVGSTQYILEQGDTDFSTLIGSIFRQIKLYSSSSDLIFLKGMGDGFLAVFRSVSTAFLLASRFLETPIHPDVSIRMALHWGSVKIVPNKDVFGTEVHRVLRIERVKERDRVALETHGETLPEANRILVTKLAMERLNDSDKVKFQPAGKFRLKGFHEPCELWMLHK